MVEAYEAKFTPHADMVRDIKFGGAWFEVAHHVGEIGRAHV